MLSIEGYDYELHTFMDLNWRLMIVLLLGQDNINEVDSIQSHKHCKAPSKLRLRASLELACQMKWSGLGKLKALVILEIEITKVAPHVEFETTKVLGLYLRSLSHQNFKDSLFIDLFED